MGHTGFQPMKCDGRSVFDEKVNVILTALNIAVLWRAGSLAVPTRRVHNVVDLAAYELTREALLDTSAVPRVTAWVLAGVEIRVHRADSVEAALAAQP